MFWCTAAHADVTTPDGNTIPCYCTNTSGDRVELGEVMCLFVDGRNFTAQCQMSLNVPMWRKLNEGCLSSGLKPQISQPPVNARLIDPKV